MKTYQSKAYFGFNELFCFEKAVLRPEIALILKVKMAKICFLFFFDFHT